MKKLSIGILMLLTGSIGLSANSVEYLEQSVEDTIKSASIAIEQINNSIKLMDRIYLTTKKGMLTAYQDDIMKYAEDSIILLDNDVQAIKAHALVMFPLTKAMVALYNIVDENEELTLRINELDRMGEFLSELSIKAANKKNIIIEILKKMRRHSFDQEVEFSQTLNDEKEIL